MTPFEQMVLRGLAIIAHGQTLYPPVQGHGTAADQLSNLLVEHARRVNEFNKSVYVLIAESDK